jgi:hypothetical protein
MRYPRNILTMIDEGVAARIRGLIIAEGTYADEGARFLFITASKLC